MCFRFRKSLYVLELAPYIWCLLLCQSILLRASILYIRSLIRNAKSIDLTREELEVLREYIDANLVKGFLHPSHSTESTLPRLRPLHLPSLEAMSEKNNFLNHRHIKFLRSILSSKFKVSRKI